MMLVTDLGLNCQNWQVLEPLFFRHPVRNKASRVFDNQLKSHALEVPWQEQLSRCWWRKNARHRYDKTAGNEVRVKMPQKCGGP